MSFNNDEKIQVSDGLKNQISIIAPISPGKQHAYNSNFPWYIVTPPHKIWTDFNRIPPALNTTEADDAVIANPDILEKRKIRLTLEPTSNNRAFLARNVYNDNTSIMLENWILPALIQYQGSLSAGYSVRLYNGDPDSGGVEIPSSYLSGTDGTPSWEFLYASGILKISTDQSSHFKGIYDTNGLYLVAYRYIGPTGAGAGSGASDSRTIIDTFTCEPTANVGDRVYISSLDNNKVLVLTDNRESSPCIGIISSKLSSTIANVQILGKVNYSFSGTDRGRIVYLSEAGGFTTDAPTTGYYQILGVCISSTQLLLKPEYRRVWRG